MQLASPITPCAASSFSIFGLSRFVMTISTPSLIRIDHSVPKVCADVASSPCTFLRNAISRHHVMPPRLHIRPQMLTTDEPHLCSSVMQKEHSMEVLRAAGMLSQH